ncbi:MAG: dihydrofolate reductase [bacterium]|nr:dihydrofolate reductase [bacterium]
MKISLIAAMAENRVIGRGNELPWHLPADLKRFKALTTGHVIVMGRKTFESIGKPLPNRHSVVITRNPEYRAPGVSVVRNLEGALEKAAGDDEVFVIGGATIFAQALPRADRLYLTLVHAEPPGDVKFPHLPADEWLLSEDEPHPADERHACPYTFRRYERRGRGSV